MPKQIRELERDWRSHAILLHGRNSVANADVYLVEVDGEVVLAKTYAGNPVWSRWLFGRIALAREFRALDTLRELGGVPHAYGLVNGDTLLTEYVAEGTTLTSHEDSPRDAWPPLDFFHRLRELVDTMHRQGIAHGDMRRRNIMRAKGEIPYLIDFTTAVQRRKRNPLSCLLFRALWRADDFAVIKLQASFYPDSLSAEDRQRMLDRPWYLRVGQFIRKRVYRKWIKQSHWQERAKTCREAVAKLRN
ncbi:MAG: RIO1 family regulatory kinase/ATPase [Lentisphaeria bacterium]|jgi:tRNA A-37 threonylcarbamoyl transferase component Bud32|nr:RIO1 family regulatory kinase/ATPase [Lentisphaeria bacterium]